MVSLGSLVSGNIVTIGVILAGVALFFGLGGAQGIGARIGGGFKDFGSSFIGGLGGAFGFEGEGEKPASETDPLSPPLSLTGQAPALGLPQLNANLLATQGTLQGVNNFFSNLFSGAFFNPNAFEFAPSFSQSAITTRIGLQSGTVSGSGLQTGGLGAGGTPFGGFTSANAQEIALQNAIVQSQIDNPSFFLK